MCFPVRAVLGGAGREGGVLTLSRPKTQEQKAQKVFHCLRMATMHSSPFKVTSWGRVCGHQTSGHRSQVLWIPHPIPEHTHLLRGRQGLTGRSHLEGDWSEELSCW